MRSLRQKRISPDIITKLRQYIEDEDFDTDSINIDIDQDSEGHITGNIAQAMADGSIMVAIWQFLQDNKS